MAQRAGPPLERNIIFEQITILDHIDNLRLWNASDYAAFKPK
jgi:hypothetical protein